MSQFFPSPHHAFLYSHSRFFSLSISIIYCVASFLHSLSLSLSVYVCVCSHLWLQTELRSRHHSPSSSPCHHHSSFLCLLYSLRESFTFFTFTQRIFRDTHTLSQTHRSCLCLCLLGAWCLVFPPPLLRHAASTKSSKRDRKEVFKIQQDHTTDKDQGMEEMRKEKGGICKYMSGIVSI